MAEEGRIQKLKNINSLLDLIPSRGGIKLKDAVEKLKADRKLVDSWSKELGRRKLVRRKRRFLLLGDHILSATGWLINQRKLEEIKEQIAKEREKTFKRITTTADDLLLIAMEEKQVTVNKAASILGVDRKTIEGWSKSMKDLTSIEYPVNVLASPVIKAKKIKVREKPPAGRGGNLLESYEITADKVPARVSLYTSREESMPQYRVELPEVGEATSSLLDSALDKLTDRIQIEAEDVSDPKRMVRLKDIFFTAARKLVEEEITAEGDDIDILAGMILHRAYGLGNLELLMSDDWLEEVCVNTSHVPLIVYHKRYGWMKTNLLLENEKAIYNYAAQIGRKVERTITNLNPIMDAHLLTGDRVCASLFPISSSGNTITIRKFARRPWTITHFIKPDYLTFSREIAAFLWLCFQYELNVIVGGGTASGKTSALNCLCSLIQPTQRIVTIEDTREINLPRYLHWNWIPLTTREPNPEGKGEVSMLDLIVTSLRIRPDRIILGEIRRKREAEVLFEAMHTGHSVYATMHCDTARNLKRRLLEPPIDLPSAEIEALHLIVIQHRDRVSGKRKTFEVAEIIPGAEGKEFDLNYLFRWNPRNQEFTKINESTRIFDDLNLHTGMNREEIKENLRGKETVLQWMIDNKIYDIDSVGEAMGRYYKKPEDLMEDIRSGKSTTPPEGGVELINTQNACKKYGGENAG